VLLGFNTGNSTLYGSISAKVRCDSDARRSLFHRERNYTQRHATTRSGTHSSLDSASTALRFLGPWMVMMGRTRTGRSTTKGPGEGGTQDTNGRQQRESKSHTDMTNGPQRTPTVDSAHQQLLHSQAHTDPQAHRAAQSAQSHTEPHSHTESHRHPNPILYFGIPFAPVKLME
jgi:hypothetical protein